jgi:hypothetical protein
MSPAGKRNTLAMMEKTGLCASGLGKKMSFSEKSERWSPLGDMKTSSVAVGPDLVYVVQKALGVEYRNSDGDISIENRPLFTLLALDKKDGGEVWRYSELRNCIKLGYCSSPVVTKNTVIVGWGEGSLKCLAKRNGETIWADTLDGDIISSPTVADGMLYVATMAGTLYAYGFLQTPPGLDFKTSTYCYPNPARTTSSIQYYLPKSGDVEVRIYDAAERLVKKFTRNTIAAGTKDTFGWKLNSVANGVYFAIVAVSYRDGSKDRKILKIAVLR